MARNAVLITRPKQDAAATARLIEARGFEPVVAPVMAIQTRRVLPPRTGVAAVVVTSGNALAGLSPALHGTTLLAVGSATAERARQSGFTMVLDAEGDAQDLAVLVSRTMPPCSRLLFAHGVGLGDALAAALQAAGFAVHRRRAYEAVGLRRMAPAALEALQQDRLLAAMFLSAETARHFVRLLPEALHPHLAGLDALAISPAVAHALAPLPWRRVRVSLKPNLDEVLALL